VACCWRRTAHRRTTHRKNVSSCRHLPTPARKYGINQRSPDKTGPLFGAGTPGREITVTRLRRAPTSGPHAHSQFSFGATFQYLACVHLCKALQYLNLDLGRPFQSSSYHTKATPCLIPLWSNRPTQPAVPLTFVRYWW